MCQLLTTRLNALNGSASLLLLGQCLRLLLAFLQFPILVQEATTTISKFCVSFTIYFKPYEANSTLIVGSI